MQLPAKLSRYAAVAKLFLKHRSHLVNGDGDADDAAALARDLEQLGPTFIKLGQLLSSRSDLLPPAYVDALGRLQDRVEPFAFADVERILKAELGVRLSKAFGMFEAQPLAAASLGQVHRAALRDGRFVAVKVQRPDVARQVASDMDVLAEIAELADRRGGAAGYDFSEIIEEFRKTTLDELDYRREAANLQKLARNLSGFRTIVIPQPIDDYSTGRVLTMDYVLGTKVTSLSPLTRVDTDVDRLGRELVRAYLHQIIVDGFFHADPHPGNVFLTDDARIALVDLGMVGYLSSRLQDRLLELMLAAADGRADEAADVIVDLGDRVEGFDEAALRKDVTDLVGRYQHAALNEVEVGRVLLEINRSAGAHGLKAPSELTMLGKTLINLDQVARALAPDLDVNQTIREQSVTLIRQRMLKAAAPSNVLATMIEAKHFAERMPGPERW